ncbi:MAG TPA: RyR domain-containing protein, partial [Thermoanaerobaculia bacterium]|nr:RyR domain-containing protein [Thermoanaerobaculia bacterium]
MWWNDPAQGALPRAPHESSIPPRAEHRRRGLYEKVEARIALTYRPAPRDTSGVSLPKPIEQLTELLAKNTHENW